jgi:uncharacterized protein YcnI
MEVRLSIAVTALATAALVAAGSALAHSHVLPEEALAEETQVFTLAVPNEKDDASTTKVVLAVPEGFQIGQFVPAAGWTREAATSGSGEEARISQVTWTADGEGDPEGGLFQFTARAESEDEYVFQVEQSYSDGSVVDWAGEEDSDTPAPVVEAKGSLGDGGGGSSTLAIVALVVGGLAALLAGAALAMRSGRQIA